MPRHDSPVTDKPTPPHRRPYAPPTLTHYGTMDHIVMQSPRYDAAASFSAKGDIKILKRGDFFGS